MASSWLQIGEVAKPLLPPIDPPLCNMHVAHSLFATPQKCITLSVQEEADKLKNLTSDNSRTKVVALGIGSQIGLNELNRTVSEPTDRNRFQAVNFSSLSDVEDQLRNAICSGWYWSLIIDNTTSSLEIVFFCFVYFFVH